MDETNINTKNTNIETDEIETTILSDGYIGNNNLWRRWIMAQMLRHYRGENNSSNFDKYFVSGKPFKYSWQTAANEIKVLSKLTNTDLSKRERFFNKSVICEMAKDYEKRFWQYFKKQTRRKDSGYYPTKKAMLLHTYVKIPSFGNVYIDDNATLITSTDIHLSTLQNKISKTVHKIVTSNSYDAVYKAVTKLIETCPMPCELAKASAWKNAFKGSGAYYTMDNMIKFHNCYWFKTIDDKKSPLSTAESLEMLEQTTSNLKSEYYKLYAIMCDFIDNNDFDIEKGLTTD